MRPAILESKLGASCQIGHGTRDEHLLRPGCVANPCRHMDGDAPEITIGQELDLARVQSAPHLHVKHVYAEGDLARGTQRVAGQVERNQVAVSDLLHDAPAMEPDTLGNVFVEIFPDARPPGVAHAGDFRRRAHDVGEQQREELVLV